MTMAKKRSTILSYDDLIEDPALDEEFRDILREGRRKPVRDLESARSLFSTLDKYKKSRALYQMAKTVIETLKEPKIDIDALTKGVTNTLTQIISRENTADQIRVIGKDANALELVDEALDTEDEALYKTGYKEFDDKSGGLPAEGVFLMAATTSGGKSALRMNLMKNIYKLNAIDVATVSFEMNAPKETRRLLSCLTGIEYWKFVRKSLSEEERAKAKLEWRRLHRFGVKNDCKYSVLCPTRGLNIRQLLTLMKPYKYKAIAIDYISLLDDGGQKDQWKLLSDITRECKVFSAETKCLVILLAQLDSEDDRVRYSKGILENADNCITGDALISTPNGLRRLDTLAGSQPIGARVADKKIRIVSNGKVRSATAWVDRGIKPVRKLTSHKGFSLKGTEEHPVLVLEPNLEMQWKALSDIQAGDYIALDTRHNWSTKDAYIPLPVGVYSSFNLSKGRLYTSWTPPSLPKRITPAVARVMGHLIAEGTVHKRCIEFVTAHTEVIEDYWKSIEEAFGLSLHRPLQEDTHYRCRIDRKWIVNFFNQIPGFTGGASNKYIPDCVMTSSKPVVTAFLRGLFEGDDGKGSTRVYYYTTSAELATQVQLLLLRYGIVARLTVGKKRTNPFNGASAKDMHTVEILGYDNLVSFYEQIGFISARKDLKPKEVKFQKPRLYIPYVAGILRERHEGSRNGLLSSGRMFGQSDSSHCLGVDRLNDVAFMQKLKLLDPIIHQRLSLVSKSGLAWDRVVSNRKAGNERVYDITVPSTESFIANGIVVHNCWVWNYSKQEQRDLHVLPIKQLKARDQEVYPFDLRENFGHMQVLNLEEDCADESVEDGDYRRSNERRAARKREAVEVDDPLSDPSVSVE